jgi:uncharacterized LabA/DUF88 family protein
MDRCGVFVDAGHLLAEAGALCLGTKSRGEIGCDYPGVIEALLRFAEEHSGYPPLRLYWYDGAPDAVPLPWHLEIGGLPHVKLRMGRIVGGKKNRRQKGVDSLIVRDLIVLARERAICTAYLLAGDEDLREGVATAQEQGLQVILLGIPPKWGPANQAHPLIREADQHVVLPEAFWAPFLKKTGQPEPLLKAPPTEAPSPSELGEAFAAAWLERADPEDIQKLIEKAPRIPTELDVELLVQAERSLGSLRGRQVERRALREAFWRTIKGKRPKESQP